MKLVHTETQVDRVRRWLFANPDKELSQDMTNQWRPPVYRLGAVIWELRHHHGLDIVKRVESRRAHYQLLVEQVGPLTQTTFPFSGSSQELAESLLDTASVLLKQADRLRSLAAQVEDLVKSQSNEAGVQK